MGTTYRGYNPSHEVYDHTVAVGDIIEADGQEWIVKAIRPHEIEVGCRGCASTDHAGYRYDQHGTIERCDMCAVFASDDEARKAVAQGREHWQL